MTLEERARAALAQGDVAGAAASAQQLVRDYPDNAGGYFLLGIVAAQTGQVSRAIPLLEAAVEREGNAEQLAHLARILILARRDGAAAQAAESALALSPHDPLTLDTIGCVLARLGRHEASIAPFEAAVAGRPDNLEFRYNLAAANGFTGRVDAARRHYEEILKRDPGDARSHYGLAILSRQSAADNHVARLEDALAQAGDPGDLLRIRYALAKELEDLGRNDEAFTHLAAAGAAQKRALGYDFSQDAAIFDAIETAFGHAGGHGGAPLCASDREAGREVIFVVGMPRTGTTLVDRILSSHRDVGSAGELQAMPLAVKRLSGTSSRTVIDPETVAAGAAIDPDALGRAYLAQAAHHRPPGSPRFVDKLPANFLYVGQIARALPAARIVCLRRDPMDSVWSNYKNLFASHSAYYAYSYDLMDTARYFARFDRLMAIWERLHPGRVLQLPYEALVADQEGQTRRLLDHCGLAWDPACLSFHENAAPVATPSAAQVRRPLNADAVGRWRAYGEALAPVADWLESRGIAVR